jgi:hypothetical protein
MADGYVPGERRMALWRDSKGTPLPSWGDAAKNAIRANGVPRKGMAGPQKADPSLRPAPVPQPRDGKEKARDFVRDDTRYIAAGGDIEKCAATKATTEPTPTAARFDKAEPAATNSTANNRPL